jgi:hypothetical protein
MSLRKHPFMYGKTSAVGWGEIWDEIKPLAHAVLAGDKIHKTDDLLFFQRDVTKAPEECYHSWTCETNLRPCLKLAPADLTGS